MRPLFAAPKWYQDAAGQEQAYEGTLDINAGDGKIGPAARFCSFRLVALEEGKPISRPVYMNGKDQLLAPHLGRRVRLIAKAVESDVDGVKTIELWPAQIAVLGDASENIGELKVLARTSNWYPAVRRVQPQPVIIRDGDELAKFRGFGGENAGQEATGQLARMFEPRPGAIGIQGIDWKKQMVVSLCAGLKPAGTKAEVSRLVVQEKWLEVHWKLTSTPGFAGGGMTYPCETVLLPRFDGEVRFFQEGVRQPVVVPAVGTPMNPMPGAAPAK
jgi:hypothetical protein